MRMMVVVSLILLPSSAFAQTARDDETVSIGPWEIATSYKGAKFENCSMSRSIGDINMSFVRSGDGLSLALDSAKWSLERGKAYPVRLAAGSRSAEAQAQAEAKSVTIALADASLRDKLRTANVLEVRGEGSTIRVPLDRSAAALGRLETCFEKNGLGPEANPFAAPSRKP